MGTEMADLKSVSLSFDLKWDSGGSNGWLLVAELIAKKNSIMDPWWPGIAFWTVGLLISGHQKLISGGQKCISGGPKPISGGRKWAW